MKRHTPLDPFAPLTRTELSQLDRFLTVHATTHRTLSLSALDGYQTALIIGPTTVLPSEWLPGVWGGDGTPPNFASDAEAERIYGMMLRNMNSIVAEFEVDPEAFEPLFDMEEFKGRDYIVGDAWSEGFMSAVELKREDWQPLFDSAAMLDILQPLRLLSGDVITEANLQLIATPSKRQKLTQKIPKALAAIHGFWLPYREAAHAEMPQPETVRRSAPKVGRNDPCPCGSGVKFKKCCGGVTILH